jgi:hypothetical protein
MYCVNCGSDLKQDSQFCGQCGTRVVELNPSRSASHTREPNMPYVSGAQSQSPYDRHTGNVPRTSRTTTIPDIPHVVFLAIGVAQVIGVIIFLIKYWAELSSFGGAIDEFVQFAIPFALGDLILVSPIVLVGLSARNASNPALLAAASVSGLVQSTRAIPSILKRGLDFDFYNIGLTSSATTFLPISLIAGAAIFVLPLAVLKLKPGQWMVGPQSDWWRASLGFFAVVLLMFEYPGRVLSDVWPVLGLTVLVTMTAIGFMESPIALGAFLGLGAATIGSMIAYGGHWLLLGGDRYDFSSVSLPSLLAFALSLVGVVATNNHASLSLKQQPNSR